MFKHKYNLKQHYRVHLKQSPYTCPFCNKPYHLKSSFNYHYKSCKANPEYKSKVERMLDEKEVQEKEEEEDGE